MPRAVLAVLALLACGVLCLPLLDETTGNVLYGAVSLAALALGWWGVARWRPARRGPWIAVLGGFCAWWLGDVAWEVEELLYAERPFPAWSDVVYLSGYVAMAVGALGLVRSRRAGRDLTAALDASIIAVGVAVPATAFVITPLAADSTLTALGRLVSSSYPVLDLFLLAVLARLLSGPGARTTSFRLLVASLAATLCADMAYDVAVVTTSADQVSSWLDMSWLAAYVLVAAAAVSPSMRDLTEPPPARQGAVSRRRLVVLALGSMLPGATLLLDGAHGGGVAWVPVGAGAVVLSGLVLARMSGLLEQVQVQAVQLSALARLDPLTGAPNRRTWDHELSRACARARDEGSALSVGMIDLDRFKRYNDEHGHQAGDRLLREAVAAWSALLEPGQLLARYGGEEFAVLLPGLEAGQAQTVLDALRLATPQGQSFSGGVATWAPGTDPGDALAAADAALYDAKRRGRDRVVAARPVRGEAALPDRLRALRVTLEPVADAATGALAATSVRLRFGSDVDAAAVLAAAHEDGHGDVLEASALATAMGMARPVGARLLADVSVAALGSARFWDAVPADLAGVVVEPVDLADAVERTQPAAERRRVQGVEALRARGAQVTLEDLAAQEGDLRGFVDLRPDVVRVGPEVVHGCAGDPARRRLVELVVQVARTAGAQVWAEGVEERADLDALRDAGVVLVQGRVLEAAGSAASATSTTSRSSASSPPVVPHQVPHPPPVVPAPRR